MIAVIHLHAPDNPYVQLTVMNVVKTAKPVSGNQ